MCLSSKVIFLQSKSSTATVHFDILLLRKHCWLRIKLNYLDVNYSASLNIVLNEWWKREKFKWCRGACTKKMIKRFFSIIITFYYLLLSIKRLDNLSFLSIFKLVV